MNKRRKLLVILVGVALWLGLMFYLITTICEAADVTLSLNPNSTTEPAGYKLYYGTKTKNYTSSVDLGAQVRDVQFTVSIEEIVPGNTYYFAATAYDVDKNESAYSAEVYKTVPLLAPTLQNVTIVMTVIVN